MPCACGLRVVKRIVKRFIELGRKPIHRIYDNGCERVDERVFGRHDIFCKPGHFNFKMERRHVARRSCHRRWNLNVRCRGQLQDRR